MSPRSLILIALSVLPLTAHAYRPWRGGYWYHGPHGGHAGWWWVAGGAWYFYPRPVYPYPVYVNPPVVVQQQPVVVQPMPVAPQMPPQAVAPAPVPPQPAPPPQIAMPMPTIPPGYIAGFYYFCDKAHGFYPYVSTCPGGWTTVPVNPKN